MKRALTCITWTLKVLVLEFGVSFFLILTPLICFGLKKPSEETFNLSQPILSSTLSPEDLKLVFGNSPLFWRTLQFLSILVRFAGNVAFISYNFKNLPPRDPDERLNQAKHIVTWVEFPCIIFGAFVCVAHLLIWMAGKTKEHGK